MNGPQAMRRPCHITPGLCLAIIVILAIIIAPIQALAMAPKTTAPSGLKVSASVWVLAHFAELVGGQRVTVASITPAGVDPHEFEPTARSIRRVYDSDVFIFLGRNFDPWAGRLKRSLGKGGTLVLDMSAAMETALSTARPVRHALDLRGQSSATRRNDPHFWLDPVHAADMVVHIKDALLRADPAGAQAYEANAADFIRGIRLLDKLYRKGLISCEPKEVIVSHDAFSYLGKRYGFVTHAITGLSSQNEPSAGRIAELVDIMHESNIGHVLAEPFSSTRMAKVIAGESKAEVLFLNTLGTLSTSDIASGRTYLSVMRDNLDVLKKAMRCE